MKGKTISKKLEKELFFQEKSFLSKFSLLLVKAYLLFNASTKVLPISAGDFETGIPASLKALIFSAALPFPSVEI